MSVLHVSKIKLGRHQLSVRVKERRANFLGTARRLLASVSLTDEFGEVEVKLELRQGLAIENDPRSPLVRRREVLGRQSKGVHQSIAFLARDASGDVGIIISPARLFGAKRSRKAGVKIGALNAVDKGEPVRRGRVVLHRTSLDKVAKTLNLTVLAAELPASIRVLRFFGIAVGEEAEIHDRPHIR